MKVIYVTDFHGDRWRYNRLIEVTRNLEADVVINGGDLFPKSGNLLDQGKFITDFLENYFSFFEEEGIYYLCYQGNDDLMIFDELFEETCSKFSFIVSLAQKRFDIGAYTFIGMNWVADYPFQLKDRCRRDTDDYVFQQQLGPGILSTSDGWQELKDWFSYARTLPTIENELNNLVKPDDMLKTVYVIHMPPYRLGLDVCLDGRKVGSKAVYNFLLKNQPRLSLHGHIHESPEISGKWFAKLGKSICIQPGQFGGFTYVTIELDKMKIERIKQ